MRRSITTPVFVILCLVSLTITTILYPYYYFIRVGMVMLGFTAFYGLILTLSSPYTRLEKLNFRITLLDFVVTLGGFYVLVRYLLTDQLRSIPEEMIIIILTGLLYFIIRQSDATHQKRIFRNILDGIVYYGYFQCIFSFLQYIDWVPSLVGYEIGGTFGTPGDLGNFLVIPFAISLTRIQSKDLKTTKRTIFSVGIVLLLLTLLLTQARTAWISTIAIALYTYRSTFIHWFWSLFKKNKILTGLVISACLAGVFAAGFSLYEFKKGSADGRLFIWKNSITLIMEKPLFGHGYLSFASAYRAQQAEYFSNHPNDLKNALLADDVVYAYNDFIETGVEYGIVGLSLLTLILLTGLFSRSKNSDHSDYSQNAVKTSLIGILSCIPFSFPLQNYTIFTCLLILLAIKVSSIEKALFSFHLKKGVINLIRWTNVPILISMLWFTFIYLQQALAWREALIEYRVSDQPSVSKFEPLHLLQHDRSFIYTLGSIYNAIGEHEKCISIYEGYRKVCLDSKSLMSLGDSYSKIMDFEKAVSCYQEASYMVPKLFLPRYHLFKTYRRMGQREKAYNTGLEIQNTKIKIYSQTVQQIKTEINQYILSYQPSLSEKSNNID